MSCLSSAIPYYAEEMQHSWIDSQKFAKPILVKPFIKTPRVTHELKNLTAVHSALYCCTGGVESKIWYQVLKSGWTIDKKSFESYQC